MEVCEEILSRIIPSDKESKETHLFYKKLKDKMTSALQSANIKADVNVQGSIAKDTWLSGEKDIDIFISLPRRSPKITFQKVLDVVKSIANEDWIASHAEHPYIEAKLEGYKIDFVPCFKIKSAKYAGSSVDRTPLHTAYIKKHLNLRMKSEVRLLKKFMQGIGAYGAEIKIKGFSGYLCELLVLRYGSFLNALRAIASWRCGQIVDLENFYLLQFMEVKRKFSEPLIVIDPVDADRNVAAAVSKEKFGEVIMASRLFLDKPDIAFFFPEEVKPYSMKSLKENMENLGFDLVFIIFKCKETVPDIIWGELYKTTQAIKRNMSKNGFQVFRDTAWSDEIELCVLIFGLESSKISSARKHVGPPVDSSEAVRFIEKYTEKSIENRLVVGPWIDKGRWIVLVKREYTEIEAMLLDSLRNKARNMGIARNLVESIRKAEVYVNENIREFYSNKTDFAKFLTNFLQGKPKWMKFNQE